MLGTRIYFPNDNGTYGWTEVDQAATLDALNFASAESRTDPVIACFSDKRELIIFGKTRQSGILRPGTRTSRFNVPQFPNMAFVRSSRLRRKITPSSILGRMRMETPRIQDHRELSGRNF